MKLQLSMKTEHSIMKGNEWLCIETRILCRTLLNFPDASKHSRKLTQLLHPIFPSRFSHTGMIPR